MFRRRTCLAMVLFAGLVGLPTGASAYTLKRTQSGALVRWQQPAIGFRVDPQLAQLLPQRGADQATRIAMEAWRGLAGVPDLNLKKGAPGAVGHTAFDPTNGIYLLREWPLEPGRLAATATTFDSATGKMLDADVLVNGQYAFELLDESSPNPHYDLAAVLAHEMGHVLGLGESYDDRWATMWPNIGKSETHQRRITTDDEQGVIAVYADAPMTTSTGCGGLTVIPGPPSHRWLGVVVLGLILLLARRGPRLAGIVRAGSTWTAVALVCLSLPAAGRVGVPDLEASLGLSRRAEDLLERSLEGAEWTVGRARLVGVERRGGLFVSRYEVEAGASVVFLEVLGGRIGRLEQQVGEAPPPPDGAELAVARLSSGVTAWAYHREGSLSGGWLHVRPSIRLP